MQNIATFHSDKKLNINIWGPSYWYIIHLLAIRYTHKNSKLIYYFFKFLACVLPCVKCQSPIDGYPFYFKTYNIKEYMTDNKKLFLWTYNLHNFVNKKTGKNFTMGPKETYQMFNRLGIKYNHFINFLINLSQICNKFKEEKCCTYINHIIANILFIIKEIIPEFGFYIETKHINNIKDAKDTKNIIYMIADTIYNMKRAGVIDLKNIDFSQPGQEKCSSGCK